jgi:hypothetical protein
MSDYISRETIKDTMLRYGFKAPDMTVTEFVEDELPAPMWSRCGMGSGCEPTMIGAVL